MGGPFCEAPYPQLQVQDFGPGMPYRVDVQHGGKTIVIGDPTDWALQKMHLLVRPGPDAVDVVIHGLPGRFIEKLGGSHEIPASVVARLLEAAGARRGTPLRLLACHAGEAPAGGATAAGQLAAAWRGPVMGANGLLRIRQGGIEIDLVDWNPDPSGGLTPNVTGVGQGSWIEHNP
jgi:hypothetical protein